METDIESALPDADDTAAAVVEGEYEADLYDYGYDYAEQQQQGEGEAEEGEEPFPKDPYSYEGYAWDEATGQYYAVTGADPDASAYFEEDGEEVVPLAADIYEYDAGDEGTEVAGTLTALADNVETSESAELESAAASNDPATPSAAPGKKSKKKMQIKTKSERVQKRQEMLEKEEEARLQQQESDAAASADGIGVGTVGKAGGGSKTPNGPSGSRPRPTFIEREKANIRLQIRKARAIARKRIPVQVRILTQTRQHLSPLEKYFGSRSVDAALSDIFWASLKGDIRRVRYLVEIEHVSVVDSKLDPWNMQQSPLHWAAKGGSRDVIEYLISAGASVRCLDENGSFPLHLACWAGHIDAALALVKAGDSRDLYVRDFDAALAPLDWANIRGHKQLLSAIEKFEDSEWLPKFVDDLIRGIIRYKIKLYKPPPRPSKRTAAAKTEEMKKAEIETLSPDAQAATDSTLAASSTTPPSSSVESISPPSTAPTDTK